MLKKLLLCLVVAYAGLLSGCGDSESFNSQGDIVNVTQVVNSLSGLTGDVQLQTSLAAAQVAAQSITIIESDDIPAEVDELRFTGYDVNGFPIYGALRSKAANITLVDVPIEVVSLRVELLVDGLIVGGLSTPVTVADGETTVLTNPTYIFPGVSTGPSGPAGPTGPSGPSGPAGPTGPATSTVYGSFATDEGPVQSITATGGEGTVRFVDFPRVFVNPARGVTRVGAAEDEEEAVFEVDTAGDYLITYSIFFTESFVPQGPTPKFEFLRLNDGTQLDEFYWEFDLFFGGGQTLQLTVSLAAGDSIALGLDDPSSQADINVQSGTLSIVRLGPSSNSPLPDSTPTQVQQP